VPPDKNLKDHNILLKTSSTKIKKGFGVLGDKLGNLIYEKKGIMWRFLFFHLKN
jgi:hypothetical protein